MNISIFGLGYVGIVSAACFASKNHNVIGVDSKKIKVMMLQEGVSPIVEKNLPELLAEAYKNSLIRGVMNPTEAIQESDISLICVGTPNRSNGSLDTQYLERVCQQIGISIKAKNKEHLFVFRSTMVPGTLRKVMIPIIERTSKKRHGVDFHVFFNPEFLRESTAVEDFFNPPKTVIGTDNPKKAKVILDLYKGIPGPKIITDIEVAEMVKYVDNNFHALKITFANEIGQICKKLSIDSHKVMEIFISDTKLNISPTYLKPGFAFGGSCLPKDLRAINYLSKVNDLETPLLDSLIKSNRVHINNTIKKIISFNKKKIGFAGLSFKSGTDDMRESPIVDVIEHLLGKGFDIKIYDKNILFAKLIGANKQYINEHIPHLSSLLANSMEEFLYDREVVVVGNHDFIYKDIFQKVKENQLIFDLVRIEKKVDEIKNYEGICW